MTRAKAAPPTRPARSTPTPPGPPSSPESKAIAERIGVLRRAAGYDYRQFVAALEKLGHTLNPESWSRSEKGFRAVDCSDLYAAAQLLDVPVAEIVQPGISQEAERLRAELARAQERIAELKQDVETQRRQHVLDIVEAMREALKPPAQ